ncbi:MAG: hypothetical protein RLZZ546_1536 [Bacteroidota bacterium]|jgi:uncharacterized protein (DUF2147 family)
MKNIFTFLALFFFVTICSGQGKIVGLWKNVDDEDGKDKSHIQISEENGKLVATVVKLLPAATLKVCSSCKGSNKNKPIEGMRILWDLKKVTDTEYDGGQILNPKTGKIYDCFITLETADKLKVRGYMGISLVGKTQYWYRVK